MSAPLRMILRRWIVLAIGFGTLMVYVSIVAIGNLRGPATIGFLAHFFLAFGLYAAALLVAHRNAFERLNIIWLFAIAFRAILLLSPPTQPCAAIACKELVSFVRPSRARLVTRKRGSLRRAPTGEDEIYQPPD